MCTVSMIYDFAKNIPPASWTPPLYYEFNELIKRLDAIDKKLGLPDCHDPKKAEFMDEVLKRLEALEKKVEESVVKS